MVERRASEHFVVTEHDSDGDVIEVYGPFPSIKAGVKWLREVYVPEWVKAYEADAPFKADIGFFGNGACDGTTCQRWIVRNILNYKET